MRTDLDRLDLKILQLLQVDGRLSNLKLAEAVALSPTAVLARTQRLQRDGFILGYEARLALQRLVSSEIPLLPVIYVGPLLVEDDPPIGPGGAGELLIQAGGEHRPLPAVGVAITPIRFGSTSGICASAVQPFAASYAWNDSG